MDANYTDAPDWLVELFKDEPIAPTKLKSEPMPFVRGFDYEAAILARQDYLIADY